MELRYTFTKRALLEDPLQELAVVTMKASLQDFQSLIRKLYCFPEEGP